MEYRAVRVGDSDPYFEHALFGGGRQKGAQNKNHKYLARAWWKNKWRYAYTQAEARALQMLGKNQTRSEKQKINQLEKESATAKKTSDKAEKEIKRSVARAIDDTKREVTGRTNTISGGAKKVANDVSNSVRRTANSAKKSVNEFIDDVKSGVTSKQAKIKAETAVNDTKNFVNRTKENIRNTTKNAAENVKNAVNDFKNYSSDVNKRNVEAAKDLKNANLISKISNTVSKEYEKEAEDKSKNIISRLRSNWRADRYKYLGQDWANKIKGAQENYDAVQKEKNSLKYKMSDLVANGSDSRIVREGKAKANSILKSLKDTASDVASKASSAARDVGSNISNAAKSAAERAANTETGRKISDAAERISDKAFDAKASIDHKVAAQKAKTKYGSDSLQYQEAKALVDHDKAVDDLTKARDKYGVNSAEFKSAARAESKAHEAYEDAREQNLYTNNASYKKASDRASYLGSYLDNWDANGGPQTAEGKANYRKMMQELNSLENQLDSMRRG